ncbi:MAG: efflux transporter outer membrane subunit [Reichenbachiella sp.]
MIFRNTMKYIPAIVLIAILASCKMGPNYKSPEMVVPEEYNHAVNKVDSMGEIKWWKMFNDPVLDSVILVALDSNRDLRIAFNNIEQARLQYKIQKANLYPDLNATGNGSYGNYGGFRLESPTESYFVGAQLSWELDVWGKLRRLNEAELAEYLATEYGYYNYRLMMVSEVANIYFRLREMEASIDIANQTLALRDSSLNLIQERYNKGVVAEIDLNQAQIQQAIAAYAVPLYERGYRQTEHALSVVLGMNPRPLVSSISLDSLSVVKDIPVGLPSEILLRRPDVLAAEQEIIAQNARIGAAQANRFPSISLTGVGGISNGLQAFNAGAGAAWNAGLNLFGPIYNWGKNKRQVEIEKIRTESTYFNYEQVVFNAFREVEDALVAIETLQREIVARENHVRAATNAQYLSGERYDKGVTSYLEYLESQRQAFEAQLGLTSVRSELLSSYVMLYKSLGGGWITEKEYSEAK